ncbi:hypothetical protein MRX96_038752 [Rhipicephalus microplus]
MAACTEDDWHSEADRDIAEELARVATRNSSLECDLDVSVTVARSSYTATAKRSGAFEDMPSEKSGLSLDEDSLLDGDPDKDFPPGDGALISGFSDVSLPPKHTITADPLDLSVSEGDDSLGQQSPVSQHLAPIPEEPELEALLEMEHPPERSPEELSTHMEEEPSPLILDALPIPDQELSTEPGNNLHPDSSEPKLQISEQSLAESAVLPDISDTSKEDKATSTAEVKVIEDCSKTCHRRQPKASQCHHRCPSETNWEHAATWRHLSAEVRGPRSVGAEAAPPVKAKGSVAKQFLEKIGQLRGATVLSEGGHDTCTLARDLMSIEGAQKQPEKYRKEEFGELFTKKP